MSDLVSGEASESDEELQDKHKVIGSSLSKWSSLQ